MSRLNIILLIVFVGLLIWITLFSPGQISKIQRGALVIFRPFVDASAELESGVDALGTESLNSAELRERLAELERERNELKLRVLQAEKLERENNELRRALRYTERSQRALIPARILNRNPSNWYNTIIIDKGSFHGVVVDSPVIVPVGDDAGLVGKISEVIGDESSVVLLLTDEMCQVSARLEDSQEQGILSGARGAFRTLPNLKLRYLSKEADAGAGRKVVSSGAGGLFPPDLLLGEVLSLDVGTIDAEATVFPSVNFDALTDVFVVRPAISGDPLEETGPPLEGDDPENQEEDESQPVEAP